MNAHAALRARFVAHIKATGLPLVQVRRELRYSMFIRPHFTRSLQTEAKDKEMIVNLLDLRKKMVDIVEQSFGGSRSFRDGIKEAFDSFINSRQNKPAEMLAKYMSAVLRGEVVSDIGEEVLLDRSMELFRHLQVMASALPQSYLLHFNQFFSCRAKICLKSFTSPNSPDGCCCSALAASTLRKQPSHASRRYATLACSVLHVR